MALLLFIKNNLINLKKMGVLLTVKLLNNKELPNYNIKQYPTLITSNKIYTGYKEIVTIYKTNLQAYEKYNEKQNNNLESEDDIQDYFKDQIRGKEETEESFGDGGNMMDMYKMMIDRRTKHVKESKLRSVETKTTDDVITKIDKKEDNINPEYKKLDYEDSDPQDDIIEKAYWSRISES
jgi:hypothetical protein